MRPCTTLGYPALGMTESGTGIEAGSFAKMSWVSCGPRVQFIPTASAPAMASVASACAADSPKAVRPSARNVISATIGIAVERPRTARTASAASSRLPKVSSRMRSTPPSRRARACSSKISRTCVSWSEPYGFTSAPRGPSDPATKTELAGGRFARDARALAVDPLERVRPLVGRELDAVGVPGVRREDPGAGRDVVVVHFADRFGIGQVQRRFRLVGRCAARDEQRSDRAVRQEDFFGERLAKVVFHRSTNKKASRCERRGALRPDRGASPSSLLASENSGLGTCRSAPRCADPVAVGSTGRSLAHSGCGRAGVRRPGGSKSCSRH